MSQINLLSIDIVIPAKAGIQSIEKSPRSGTSVFFVGCAEAYMFSWIPAFAGMTELTGHQL